MSSLPSRIVNFVRVSPLPHATAAGSLVVGLGLGRLGLALAADGAILWAAPVAASAVGWFALALCAWADSLARHREYSRIKRMLARFGFSPKILRAVSSSRCQRDAAVRAAWETGYGRSAKAYFRSLGYRWHHLMPDRVMDNPFNFFSPSFLKATFVPGKKADSPGLGRAEPDPIA